MLNVQTSFLSMLLAWNADASYGLMPFRGDFIDYIKVDIPVKGVTKVNEVIGVGSALFKFKNDKNQDMYFPCIAYHFPIADIFIFSPQLTLISNTSIQVSIHEDNAGALVLAKTLPLQFTPCSKHYAIKTIWFHKGKLRGIKLLKVDTTKQKGNIPWANFEHLYNWLTGW